MPLGSSYDPKFVSRYQYPESFPKPKCWRCEEHQLKLSSIIRDANKNQRSLTVAWLDLAIAYGSVNHKLIEFALSHYHAPCLLIALTSNLHVPKPASNHHLSGRLTHSAFNYICGNPVDYSGVHGLSYRSSRGKILRHTALNEIVHRGLATANIPTILARSPVVSVVVMVKGQIVRPSHPGLNARR